MKKKNQKEVVFHELTSNVERTEKGAMSNAQVDNEIEESVPFIKDEDKVLIDKVIDKFADYSATDLVSLTHRQSPWIDAYAPHHNNEITIDAIREYFNG